MNRSIGCSWSAECTGRGIHVAAGGGGGGVPQVHGGGKQPTGQGALVPAQPPTHQGHR